MTFFPHAAQSKGAPDLASVGMVGYLELPPVLSIEDREV
jgi:hypothetical protein